LKICDKVRQSAIASNERSHESDSPVGALDQGTIISCPYRINSLVGAWHCHALFN